MKWDYFVYSRGIEQNDGFRLRAGPEYITTDVIKGCQAFFGIRKKDDDEGFMSEIESFDVRPWNNTFMFMPVKKFGCCLLIRAAKVESAKTGEYIDDFQGRPIWSLEGICCPYELTRYFFASLPSILLFLRRNERHSLNTLLSAGKIGESLEIPDALVFDPMSVEGKLPEGLLKTDNNNVKQAFEYLVRKIYCASSPYPFSFGPMADLVTETAGRTYSLNESISTMYISGTVSSVSDDFESYKRLTELDETAQARGQTYYTLKCGIEANGKSASSYTWHICEDGSAAGEYELSSDPIRYDPEEGIPALKLIAEAESIRELAANIGWITEPFSEGFSKIYTFVKNNR